MADESPIAVEHIEHAIRMARGQKVMLDEDLAALYGVPAKRLNEQVRRNLDRFPDDFMFQLTAAEFAVLRSQFATLDVGRGRHRKYLPYAFTEQGVAMLSSVLQSPRAVHASIEIMRAFVKLRQMLHANADLARKLVALEQKYDVHFRVVFTHACHGAQAGPRPHAQPASAPPGDGQQWSPA